MGARLHQRIVLLRLEGVETANDAEALRNSKLYVPASELVALPPDQYYLHDLVGCMVETADGREVGRVTHVDGTITGSRLEIHTPSGDVLIPLVAVICRTIDTTARRIVIDPPEGLLELNISGAGTRE